MKRAIALLTVFLGSLLALTPSASAAATSPSVIVVGVPGLQWSQVTVTGTPTLWRLSRSGASGALSIRSAADLTCPADGWLTVGAGNRVGTGLSCTATPETVTTGDTAEVPSFAAIAKHNASLQFAAVPGILSSALASKGECLAVVGVDAVLGGAGPDGKVGHYSAGVSTQSLDACHTTLVSAPVVSSTAAAAQADALVQAVDSARPAGSVLLIVGLSDTDPRDRAHLHVAIATGPGFGPGGLRSQSTRRTPYVQLIDVTATVLGLRGALGGPGVAEAVDGQPWRSSGHTAPSVRSLVDADRAAGAMRAALPWAVALLVVLATAGAALSFTGRGRVAALVSLTALAAPLCTYLVDLIPAYRTSAPTLVVLLGTLVLALPVAAAAFLVGERRSWVIAAGAVAGLTFAVLVLDVVTGSRLQLDSVLGYSPLVAGRFVGVGNVAYGVLGSSAVLAATAVAMKRPGLREVAAIGLVAVVADGAPMWGSDVGGVLALVPGFAVLLMLCAGLRLSWGRLTAVAAAAVAVVLAFGLADYARPAASQTHLGRFVGKLLHGHAGTVLDRKLHSDLDLLTANAGTLLVPVAVAVALWLILRPRPALARTYVRHPQLRYGLIALAVLALVGLVVNDSGIAIPAVAVLLGVPYLLVILTGDTSAEPPPEEQYVLP